MQDNNNKTVIHLPISILEMVIGDAWAERVAESREPGGLRRRYYDIFPPALLFTKIAYFAGLKSTHFTNSQGYMCAIHRINCNVTIFETYQGAHARFSENCADLVLQNQQYSALSILFNLIYTYISTTLETCISLNIITYNLNLISINHTAILTLPPDPFETLRVYRRGM